MLGTRLIAERTGQWQGRYALSDSVFLTHSDPLQAVHLAGDLVSNLTTLNLEADDPVLIRGAIAFGEVRHLQGIFLQSSEPANLVGDAVVEAVALETSHDLKGPRIFIPEQLLQRVREGDPVLASWQLSRTSVPGVWEILWLLPPNPGDLPANEDAIADLCRLALRLLGTKGGDPRFGAHYREFLLLAVRCIDRIGSFARAGKATPRRKVTQFLPQDQVLDLCASTSGLPDPFLLSLRELLTSIQ